MAPETERVGLAACRLSDGYLHFGHLNGCFMSDECAQVDTYIFLIQDEFVDRKTSPDYDERLVRLFRSVKALAPTGPDVKIIRQTTLKPVYATLHAFLEEISPATLVADTNPKIHDNVLSGSSLSEFAFPLNEVCNLLSVNADFAFYNDDNERFVFLARRLRKKIARLDGGIRLSRPELKPGRVQRLLGYNYMKMSKSNGNAIRLGVADDAVRRDVERLGSIRWLNKQGARFRHAIRGDASGILTPENFPLQNFAFAFLEAPQRIICSQADISNGISLCQDYAANVNRIVCDAVGNIHSELSTTLEELEAMEAEVVKGVRFRMEEALH